MNEQALLASYNLAVQNGYKKSVDDFKQLLSTNPDALNASYNLALNNGYAKSLDDYKTLVGVGAASFDAQAPAVQEVKKKDTVSPFVDGGSELTKFEPSTGQIVQETPSFTEKKPEVTIPTQKQPEMAKFGYQVGKPLPEQIPSVKPDQKQVELETNPIISFGKKFWETLSKQIPSSMEAKGAQKQSQFVESDMRRLKSISDVPDDELIEMPSLTDPRGGRTTTYKAGDYKKQLAEKIARGNKATQASIELALKLNKDLSNSDVISSLTQVNDGYDLLNFISSSVGQTVAQVPLAIASGGGMSYAMESGNIYLDTVKEIAEKEGITPVQVIQQGKDQVALAEIGGAISGALDLFGAKKILDAFGLDNIKRDLRRRALTILVNSQVEGATEVGQEFVSSAAKGLGVKGELRAPTLTQALDAYAAGMFGAAGVQAPSLLIRSKKDVSEEIVQPVILDYGDSKFGFIRDESGRMEMTKELDNEEQAVSMSDMLSKAYKGLQFTIEEVQSLDPYKPTKYKIVANEIETKPIQEDAIQEQAAGEVPVQSGTGVSQEVAQGEPQAEPQGVTQEGQEKITVFRGRGNNVMNLENDETLWVAEDEEVAKNYAGVTEDGVLDVEKTEVNKPVNSIELPYKLATDVRASNIGNNLRSILANLVKEGRVAKENISKASGLIREFEDKAGKGLELFTTKINKPESREAFSKAAQALGFDSILQKESAVEGGTPTNTYGVFKKKYESLVSIEPQVATEAVVQEVVPAEVVVSSKTPEAEPAAQPQAQIAAAPITITDIKVSFAPENAIEVQKGTREDTRGRKFTYDAAVTSQATDQNGVPIGIMTKRSDADGKLSFTLKDVSGRNINKGKAYPTERDARAALVEQVNKKREKTTKTKDDEQVQSKRGGDGGRPAPVSKIEPLQGAPTFQGVKGPDPKIVAVAEDYATKNGIELKRQAEYVEVDEDRAKRIADAYEQMADDPKNPKVKEAYDNLVKQTMAQYQALVDAGYKFWFIDLSIPSNEEYSSSPMNAIRDLRQNKEMGVFSTKDGYGDSEITQENIDNNPLLANTGLEWPVGGVDGPLQPVLANDLFRAVHDTFGHGLEGAGFRARGEENAWQAHVRLFTGSAIPALTSETRGQNSYVNFGPDAEFNRTASGADTKYAPQKVGLMPEFTWTEGRAGDMEVETKPAAKPTAKKAPTKTEVEEVVAGKLDELLELDPKSKGTGQKILDGIDGLIKDIEKLEKGTLGVNIALPIMKNILKGIRTLVEAGIVLADAIKQVAKDNGVTVKQVVNGMNAIGQIAPIQAAYDALMTKADALIARQKSRDIPEKKIVSNLDTMIRNSEVYKNATDAQRKIMEREARIKMGVGPRKAASIGRVIGVLKDITNVSRQEKLQIIGRIRELSRDVAKDLAEEIRGLAKEGKITAIQAANIIAKFGNVNLLNEVSVSNFVDYMAKVFADAEYDSKIARANSRVAKARKNIATKIGIADGLMLPLQKLFAVNPNLIPDNSLERYLELLDVFSASEAVLTLDEKSVVKKDVDAILDEINNEQSRADELAELFSKSDNQVFDDGDLDYAASLKNMVREGEITEDDADLMRKYKQDIIPQVEPTTLSDEEIAKKKNESISVLQKQKVNAEGLPSQDERNLAKRLAKLIKETSPENLMKLNLTDLKNLLKVTSNINNNYLPHYAQVMVEKLNAINNGKVIAGAIKTAKPLSFSALYSKLKAAIIKSQKGGISELVRRNPLFYIDQVFGNFKTKDIFNALFEKAAEGEANFKAELKKVQNILENAESKVAKSFKLNPDKTLMSKFKMMTYMIQLEYESNKGSQQVNPAADYLKATIKHIDEGKSRFGERDGNMLQDILDQYTTNGQIDIEKLYNSFNQAEKDAVKDIRGINESLKDKAQYTAAIIRGDAIDPLNNYVHLNVLHDTEPLDMSAATDFLNQANNSRRPSTRAKSLITRTKGAKPLNFDVFASAQRGAKFVLLDYNLTEPIRTARRTINQATADLEKEGRLPKEQREIKNAIEGAFEESVTNLLTNSILQNTFADEVIDFIGKQGYRAVLAGTGRFAAELTSNISFALLADPKAFTAGTKYRDIIMSTDAPLVLENVNSKQTNRIFPADTLSGRLVDTSILNQAAGIQSSSSKNPVFNKMQQIYNRTIKKPKNIVELTADTLISTPDKLVMRPLWFGSFANEFKSITGNDVDFKKIAENNEAYMEANKDAIEQSKKLADERSVMAGATDNAFMGILKGTLKPNQSGWAKAFNNFNNYMTRFLIFEYVTARTAIYALVGDGSLSKKQGAAMLGAVFTRMTVYTVLSSMLASGIMGLVGFDDEEDETEKSLMQKIGQSLVGTFASLLFGRDFGNATKLAINYGLEEINERYLDFLREGEYDPYKDGIAYSLIPREDRPNDNIGNFIMSMSGSLGPALNTADLIYRNRTRIITGKTTKKELDAIQREERTVKERIPLEVLGHLGFIPFYKDVRKAVNNSIYSSIKEAEKTAARSKQKEVDLLGGYENKEDLKRYNRALYEQNFGEGSEWYQSTKEEREAKEKEAKEERANKDRMYNYTPKEDGFGSSGFGEGTKKRQRKSGGGFGGKKFGED